MAAPRTISAASADGREASDVGRFSRHPVTHAGSKSATPMNCCVRSHHRFNRCSRFVVWKRGFTAAASLPTNGDATRLPLYLGRGWGFRTGRRDILKGAHSEPWCVYESKWDRRRGWRHARSTILRAADPEFALRLPSLPLGSGRRRAAHTQDHKQPPASFIRLSDPQAEASRQATRPSLGRRPGALHGGAAVPRIDHQRSS